MENGEGASFILIPLDKPNAKEVTKFFKWAFERGSKIAEDLYYIPLPKNLVHLIYEYWGKYKINP